MTSRRTHHRPARLAGIRGLLLGALAVGAALAHADNLYIYPAKGQSPQQEDEDKGACMSFATSQTGFNPMNEPTATSAPPPQQGGAGRGLFGGALLGTVVGAIAGNTAEGAEIGAAAGGLFGGMRAKQSRDQQQQWADQQASQYQQNRDNFNRAYSACLEGRGYTVN